LPWRTRALARAWAERGGDDLLAQRPVLRELTLSGTEGTGARTLAAWIAALREGAEAPLIRIERDWSASDPEPAALEEAARYLGEWPASLHGVVLDADSLAGAWSESLDRLAEQGWPLSAELWLLRGRNDDVEDLRALMLRLLTLHVRPYYLVDGEWLPGDLRVPATRAVELVRGLRGWISGLAVPQLVHEDDQGRREPVVPNYIEAMDAERVTVRNYAGRIHHYRNPIGREGTEGQGSSSPFSSPSSSSPSRPSPSRSSSSSSS
jgi:lysine 2,3-aminomutase